MSADREIEVGIRFLDDGSDHVTADDLESLSFVAARHDVSADRLAAVYRVPQADALRAVAWARRR